MSTTQNQLRSLIRYLLEAPGRLPKDWAPPVTTYDLPRFHGHDAFIARFQAAADAIQAGADPVVALAAAGLPYDYARLGTPWTSVYELYVQTLTGAARAIAFASRTKAFLAPSRCPGGPAPRGCSIAATCRSPMNSARGGPPAASRSCAARASPPATPAA